MKEKRFEIDQVPGGPLIVRRMVRPGVFACCERQGDKSTCYLQKGSWEKVVSGRAMARECSPALFGM